MMRQVEISRDEAELLTDLLMLSGDQRARELSELLRDKFGMISESAELTAKGMTLEAYRKHNV